MTKQLAQYSVPINYVLSMFPFVNVQRHGDERPLNFTLVRL